MIVHPATGSRVRGRCWPALVSRYRAAVYSYLVRCGVAEADRDDLFQEIFIRIHRAASRYRPDCPLHPWLFTIVANAVGRTGAVTPASALTATVSGSSRYRNCTAVSSIVV